MMNPYVRIKEKKYVRPNQKVNVTYGVRVDNKLYYQIAEKTFISAEFVNLDLRRNDIAPYENKKIIAKPNTKVAIYSYPDNQAKTKKFLPANTLFKIQNFNGGPKNMWLYTKKGWIKADQILFYGFFNKKAFQQYNNLPRVSKYTNLVLLPFNPNKLIFTSTYWQKRKQINQIIH